MVGRGAGLLFLIVTVAFVVFLIIYFFTICDEHISVNLTRVVLFDISGEHFREHMRGGQKTLWFEF